MSSKVKNKKSNIAILGFGKEGKSLLKFLKKSPKFKNSKIKILDQKLDKDYLKNLKQFDLIFRSPGVPYNLREIQNAKKLGVEIGSATKLFFNELRRSAQAYQSTTKSLPKIIGVTGSKGKGTTCTLICKILKNSGFKTVLAGNIGKPMLNILAEAKKSDFIVLELSSFQLQDLTQSPEIAVVLDIFPDHLDSHKNSKEYYSAKTNIGLYQKKTDAIFYFSNNSLSKKIASQSPAKKLPVTPKENNLKKNYEMAIQIARFLKCPEKIIKKTIKNFKGLEHRLESVRIIRVNPRFDPRESAFVKFINDSAATNPEATAAAIKTLEASNPSSASLILIAGGKDKKLNYMLLAKTVKNSKNLKTVILFGENKNKIKSEIGNIKLRTEIKSAENLKSAVKIAYKFAKKLINSSTNELITILFSPASASFDMFKNYEDRGKKFKKIVKSLR